MRFEQFFAKFWIPGLLGPLLASSWPLLAFFWASSWLLLASSWPVLASFWLFPGFSKISKVQVPPETSFSVHKTLRFEQFFAKFWIPGLLGPLLASSWPLLAFPWPLLGLFWPLPGFFWPLPVLFWPLFGFFLDFAKSPKFKRFQRRYFLFIKHCVSSSFSPNSGFLAFWGLFVRNPAYPVVFGRCAPAASLRLRLGPVKDNDRRRRCPSPRWDA